MTGNPAEKELEASLAASDEVGREAVFQGSVHWRERRHQRTREAPGQLTSEPHKVPVASANKKVTRGEARVVGDGADLELRCTAHTGGVSVMIAGL